MNRPPQRNSVPRDGWYYNISVGGLTVGAYRPDAGSRHEGRVAYCLDPVIDLFGGSLAGKHVLDLGCNAGLFSLRAIQAGADHVTGIDADAKYIEQANTVFQAAGIERPRYMFEATDLFEHFGKTQRAWDVVLCLGLAHHLEMRDYFRFFELMASRCDDVVVVDTIVSSVRVGSLFQVYHKQEAHRANPHADLVMHPSCQALIDLMGAYGFRGFVLRPSFDDRKVFRDYLDGGRRAFVFAKVTDLGDLSQQVGESTGKDIELPGVRAGELIRDLARRAGRRLIGR